MRGILAAALLLASFASSDSLLHADEPAVGRWPPRVIFNSDAASTTLYRYPVPISEQQCVQTIASLEGTPVDAYSMSIGAGGSVFWESRFGHIYGSGVETWAIRPGAEKLLASKLVVRFAYSEPDVVIVVDCTGDEVDVRVGDTESEATVEMASTADLAHKFWFGKMNLTRALTRRQVIVKGPVPRILKLLPAIRPTYALYPQYLEDNGYGEYNIY